MRRNLGYLGWNCDCDYPENVSFNNNIAPSVGENTDGQTNNEPLTQDPIDLHNIVGQFDRITLGNRNRTTTMHGSSNNAQNPPDIGTEQNVLFQGYEHGQFNPHQNQFIPYSMPQEASGVTGGNFSFEGSQDNNNLDGDESFEMRDMDTNIGSPPTWNNSNENSHDAEGEGSDWEAEPVFSAVYYNFSPDDENWDEK